MKENFEVSEMPKIMQGIVLFIEPNDDAFHTPIKIGNLFMNRFAIDEDAGFEILNVLELEKTSYKMYWPNHPEYKNYETERKIKGKGLVDLYKTLYGKNYTPLYIL